MCMPLPHLSWGMGWPSWRTHNDTSSLYAPSAYDATTTNNSLLAVNLPVAPKLHPRAFPPGGYTQRAAQPPIWNGASGGQGGSTSSAGSGYNTKSVSMGCTAAPTPLWMASWSSLYNPWAGSIQMWPMCSYAGLAAARPSSRHPEAYSVYWTFVPQVLCWPNSWFAPR